MHKKVLEDLTGYKMSRKSFILSLRNFSVGGYYIYFFEKFHLKIEQEPVTRAYGSGPYGG